MRLTATPLSDAILQWIADARQKQFHVADDVSITVSRIHVRVPGLKMN